MFIRAINKTLISFREDERDSVLLDVGDLFGVNDCLEELS